MTSPPPSKSSGSSPKASARTKRQLTLGLLHEDGFKANNLADGTFCFFKYSADTSKDDTEGDVEVVELTKRQRAW